MGYPKTNVALPLSAKPRIDFLTIRDLSGDG